jgi:hypothetical protein
MIFESWRVVQVLAVAAGVLVKFQHDLWGMYSRSVSDSDTPIMQHTVFAMVCRNFGKTIFVVSIFSSNSLASFYPLPWVEKEASELCFRRFLVRITATSFYYCVAVCYSLSLSSILVLLSTIMYSEISLRNRVCSPFFCFVYSLAPNVRIHTEACKE